MSSLIKADGINNELRSLKHRPCFCLKFLFKTIFFDRNEPNTSYEPSNYIGKYVTSEKWLHVTITAVVNNCSIPGVESANAILHVKCPDVCGQPSHFKNKIHQNMRISGGREASSGSHPWLVSLHLNGTFVCGGSIIEQKWVKIDSFASS